MKNLTTTITETNMLQLMNFILCKGAVVVVIVW